MTTGRLNRWLLVNYAGYPLTPSSLMPDNGLANLAGIIIADGGDVEILDYSTVKSVARMTSRPLQAHLTRAWNTLKSPGRGILPSLRKLATLATLPGAEKERRILQDKAVAEIGDELVAHIRRKGIEAVGFKLWNGDGLTGSATLAARLRRECPHVMLFGGGPHVDLFQARILNRYPTFDALIYGEGEDTLRHLLADGANPGSYPGIPNLIYASQDGIRMTEETMVKDLNQLPMPVYDPAVYPAMAGDEKIKIIVIDESRGCHNECAFCIHPVKSHRTVRVKSIDRLLREVRRLGDDYGFRAFRFAGSCTPYSLLNAFSAEVIRQALPLQYASFAHIHDGREADFALIRQSGCVALFFGIESGSQRILDRLRKRITAAEITETIQRANQAGLFTVGSLIFPAPGDDANSAAETIDLLRPLHLGSITLQPPVLMPRTRWFADPEAYGFKFSKHYLEIGLTWKLKLQLPPRFWAPLPISLDGYSYRQILNRTSVFSKQLGSLGIPTSISDENYLMSKLAGLDPVVFRDRSLGAFYAGDSATLMNLVGSINQAGAELKS
jgi:anaerobic magnesium-protoporphyrin IX monomethyl ester cyclase